MSEKLNFAIREGGRTVGAGVVTKISKVSNYKKAEEYHQKYYQKKGVLWVL